jgi:hypothetical protein
MRFSLFLNDFSKFPVHRMGWGDQWFRSSRGDQAERIIEVRNGHYQRQVDRPFAGSIGH